MAANNVSVAHQAFSNLLTTLSPEQIQQFVQQIQGNNAGSNVPQNPATTNATSAATMAPTPTRSSTTRGRRDGENTKLRPLNSFIAFRSFYSAIFPELTQKVKSGLLRFLWKSDPFKAKWAILAKAYSIIRDGNPGKGVALDSFLALTSQFIEIVAPEDYLNAMGLQLIEDGEGNYSLAASDTVSSLNATGTTTAHSVDDIVNHCYDTGYVTGAAPTNGNSHQGAFAAQPSIQANTFANPAAVGTVSGATTNTAVPTSTIVGNSNNAGGANIAQATNNGVATNATASIPGSGNVTGGNVAVATNPATNNGNVGMSNAIIGGGNVGIAANTGIAGAAGAAGNNPSPQNTHAAQVREMHRALQGQASDNNYYGLFTANRPPYYRYNPYQYGPWDAFNMEDFVNM